MTKDNGGNGLDFGIDKKLNADIDTSINPNVDVKGLGGKARIKGFNEKKNTDNLNETKAIKPIEIKRLQDSFEADLRVHDEVDKTSFGNHALSHEELFIGCARKGDAYGVQCAIEEGVDINYQDSSGMTALHYAAMNNARPCVRVLVKSGKCDYLIRDNQGRYASQLALVWGKDIGVATLLVKHQARQAYERGIPIIEP